MLWDLNGCKVFAFRIAGDGDGAMDAGDPLQFNLNVALLSLTELVPARHFGGVVGLPRFRLPIGCRYQFAGEPLTLVADQTHRGTTQSDIFHEDLRAGLEETPVPTDNITTVVSWMIRGGSSRQNIVTYRVNEGFNDDHMRIFPDVVSKNTCTDATARQNYINCLLTSI